MESDWKEISFGELFNVKHGFAFKGEHFADKPTKHLLTTPGNFAIGGGFLNTKPKFYDGPAPEDYILKARDVVVTMTDLSKASDTLGHAALIPEDENIWLHNQRVGLLEFYNPEEVNSQFICYLLRSNEYRSWIIGSATGTTVKHTSPSRIAEFSCPLPPLPEQKAIAHILGTLDEKIELNRQMNATLEAMAQALFKSWFVDFDPVIDNALAAGNPIPDELADRAETRRQALANGTANREAAKAFTYSFQETEELGWIPEGWEVKPLGEESIILNGYAFKSEDYCEDGIFVLRTKNFDANGLSSRRDDDVFLPDSFSDSHESYLSQPFDFHLVMVGASIGKTSLLLPHMLPALRNQNMWCFRPKAESMSKIFLNLSVQKKVEEVMSWASGSARSFFRKSDFRSHEILIPTKELLAQFEETVGPMYLKISSGSAETDQLTKLRDTLLPKLISGELRITKKQRINTNA
jgi:type I restriction enzyme S subunit